MVVGGLGDAWHAIFRSHEVTQSFHEQQPGSAINHSGPPSQGHSDDIQRLRQLVPLIAAGIHPVPSDLSPQGEQWLCDQVANVRRKRLIRLIARAIATELLQEWSPRARNQDEPV